MTTIFNDIRKLAEFDRDFKKLAKRFRTLDEDLNTFIANQLKKKRMVLIILIWHFSILIHHEKIREVLVAI